MVGRDIATVVAPDAGVKIFLGASAEERARRRHKELAARSSGLDFQTVFCDLNERDRIDSSRDVSPLAVDPDATVINSDAMTIEEVVDAIERIVRDTWSAPDHPNV